jgi:hypothetical protein
MAWTNERRHRTTPACGNRSVPRLWTAVAKRSDDTALGTRGKSSKFGNCSPARKRRRVRLAGALQNLADFLAAAWVAKRLGLRWQVRRDTALAWRRRPLLSESAVANQNNSYDGPLRDQFHSAGAIPIANRSWCSCVAADDRMLRAMSSHTELRQLAVIEIEPSTRPRATKGLLR